MALLRKKIIGSNIVSATAVSGSHDFNGVTPKRITLLVETTEVGTPGAYTAATLTVEVSGDGGVSLITYDKLITDAGVDAPASSAVYTAASDYDDVVSLSQEDVVDYIKVTVTPGAAGSLDSSNYVTINIWLVAEY